jgi:serine/threonine protein kinase
MDRFSLRISAFGKYNLTGKKLGDGSFSCVREAIDTESRQLVALKITDVKNMKDKYMLKHYMREAQILTDIDHPNVINLLDRCMSTNYCVLVLERFPTNLCDHIIAIKRQKIDEARGAVLFRQMVSAIAYLHDKDIVHRDVKLENILIDPKTNKIKLAGE